MQRPGNTFPANAPARLKLLAGSLVLGVGVAAILMALPAGLRYWRGGDASPEQGAGQVAPYLLPIMPPAGIDREIAFYKDRVARLPPSGLDQAYLAKAYLRKARATGELGWYLLADQAARRSLAILPAFNEGATMVLAHVAESQHDFAGALRLVDRVGAKGGRKVDVLSVRVTSLLAMGRVDAAQRAAGALVADTANVSTLSQQALVALARGRDDAAVADLTRAISVEQAEEAEASARARTYLGRLHLKRGRYALARAYFEESMRIQPKGHQTLAYLAEAEARTGQLPAARAHYEDALAIFPQASYLAGLADVEAQLGDRQRAVDLRRQAEAMLRRDLGNGSFGHRRDLARLLLQRGTPRDRAEAATLMRAELKKRQDAETWDTLAWALAAAGRQQEARRAMRQALRWGLRDADMLYRAGTIESVLGNRNKAGDFYRAALGVNPSFSHAAAARRARLEHGR